MEGNDVNSLRSAMDDLSKSSHKLAEQLYAQKSQDSGHSCSGDASGDSPGNQDNDVVDADFTEVKK
jgi:molecular chaperone DnaK